MLLLHTREAVKSCLTRAKLNEHTPSNRKVKDEITVLRILHLLAFIHAATKFICLFYLKISFHKVRRLIVLIDTLYEHKIRLVVLAAAPPTGIFTAGTTTTTTTATNGTTESATDESDAEVEAAGKFGVGGDLIGDSTYLQKNVDEVFAFDRTVSRLLEMQSKPYLKELEALELARLWESYVSYEHFRRKAIQLRSCVQLFHTSRNILTIIFQKSTNEGH